MEINCILCTDSSRGISRNLGIPWKIHDELKYFNAVTTYTSPLDLGSKMNAVLMGKNTYQSLNLKILPNRYNYVLTTTINTLSDDKLFIADDIQKIIANIKEKQIDKLFVIGGKSLYEHFINNKLVKYIYLSKIDHEYQCDNSVNLDLSNYKLIEENDVQMYDRILEKNVLVSLMKYENPNYVDNKFWTFVGGVPYINFEELQYLNIMKEILARGHYRQTRNAKTYSIFGKNIAFDLQNNTLPVLTTKKVFTRGIIEELLFFLRGQTDSKILEQKGVNIWRPNTTREFLDSVGLNHYQISDIGPMYGFQWKFFNAEYKGCHADYTGQGIDQIKQALYDLEHDKFSRRIIMTTYNPCQAKQGVLYPCHGLTIQFGIENDDLLCCHVYFRSQDLFLGTSFNITSYALLVHIFCNILNTRGQNFKPGKLHMAMGDVHIYENHLDAVNEQLKNVPFMFPKLKIKKTITNFEDISSQDFEIINYTSHQKINATMIA